MNYYFVSCRLSNNAKNRAVEDMKQFVGYFDQMVIREDQLPDLIEHFELKRKELNRKYKNCGDMAAHFYSGRPDSPSSLPMYDFAESFCAAFQAVNQKTVQITPKVVLGFEEMCVTQLSLF